jgi:CDP-glycerol glycerophosphotransferase (TagB/SpsB family)
VVRWQIPKPSIFLSTYDQPAAETPELFHLKQEQIKPFGYPRNDVFFAKKQQLRLRNFDKSQYKQVWSYLPTFRDATTSLKPFNLITLDVLDEWLEKNEAVLLIKNHPQAQSILLGAKRNNIFDISDHVIDTQTLLQHTDVLITDYSSVCIDFALTKRPCLYYVYDFEEYKRRVGFGVDFLKVLPGPFLYTEQEFMMSVHTIDNWSQTKQYKLDYQAFLNRFYLYQDGKSAQRLLQYAQRKGYN